MGGSVQVERWSERVARSEKVLGFTTIGSCAPD